MFLQISISPPARLRLASAIAQDSSLHFCFPRLGGWTNRLANTFPFLFSLQLIFGFRACQALRAKARKTNYSSNYFGQVILLRTAFCTTQTISTR